MYQERGISHSSSEILGHRRISIPFVILFRVKKTPSGKILVTNHMILIIQVKFYYSTAEGGDIGRWYGIFSEISLKLDLQPNIFQFFDFSPKSLTPTHIFPLIDFSWQHLVALIIKFPKKAQFFLNTEQFLIYGETNPPLRAHSRRFV